MTDRWPPHNPPPPPRLETYRPAGERGPQAQPRRPAPGQRPPGNHQNRGTERSSFLPTMLYGILALVVLAGIGAAAFITMLPADFVRDRVVAVVKEKTGRDLVIGGQASFTLYPSVGLTLEDVSLSAAPGMTDTKPLATMRALDARVALLPLLSREVRLEALVLREPVINLEVDKEGRKSWSFEPMRRAAAAVPSTTASAPAGELAPTLRRVHAGATGPASAESGLLRIEQLKLDDVRIENGTVNYSDARTGSRQEVKSLNARFGATAMASPLTSTGKLVWKGRPVSFDAALTSLAAVMEDRPAKLTIALATNDGEATFEGTATFRDQVEAEGILRTKSPSLRALLAWAADMNLPPSQGFGPLEAKGLIRGNANQVTFSSAEIALDGGTAHGQITLATTGARPYLKANLKLSELNLNTYATSGDAAPPSRNTAPAAAEGTSQQSPQSIDDLLSRDGKPAGPQVKGYTRRAGWSEEPYQLRSFSLLDADAKLSIGRLLVRDIKLGQTELTVALKNRVLKTTIDDVRLYDGRGRGFITMDASAGQTANLAANMTFDGISGEPFLKDAAGIERLTGKGRLAFTLAGQGANERQIIETLNGKIDFAFADGAITGVNIPQMLRSAGQGRFGDTSGGAAAKTDFSEFASTWTVTAGVAQNQDLRLVSPLLRITGAGNVMLPPREIDYLLRPRLVSDLQGQGGNQEVAGLEIPVRVSGSWDDPRIKPDFESIARDPDKAVNTIKEIGKQFKGKNAGEIVDGLLGKGQSGEPAPAKKFLDQFLKQ